MGRCPNGALGINGRRCIVAEKAAGVSDQQVGSGLFQLLKTLTVGFQIHSRVTRGSGTREHQKEKTAHDLVEALGSLSKQTSDWVALLLSTWTCHLIPTSRLPSTLDRVRGWHGPMCQAL